MSDTGTPASGGAAGKVGTLASFFAGSGASPFGWVSLGTSLLSGTDINKSGTAAGGDSQSGLAWFQAQNSGGISKPAVDLSNPVSVLIVAGLVVAGVYAIKKMRK